MKLYRVDGSNVEPPSAQMLASFRSLDDSFYVWYEIPLGKYRADWIVYSSSGGWFGVYEEKRFAEPVATTFIDGDWTLQSGDRVTNPTEQVRTHAEVLRRKIRNEIVPLFFPGRDPHDVSVFCGVLCPQIVSSTRKGQGFVRLFSNAAELALRVQSWQPSKGPLLADRPEIPEQVVAFLNGPTHFNAVPAPFSNANTSGSSATEANSTAATETPARTVGVIRQGLEAVLKVLRELDEEEGYRRKAEVTSLAEQAEMQRRASSAAQREAEERHSALESRIHAAAAIISLAIAESDQALKEMREERTRGA